MWHIVGSFVFVKKLWDLVYNWVGCKRVEGESVLELMENHRKERTRGNKSIWQLIWHVSIGTIWLMRNNVIFKDAILIPWQVLERIKVTSWTWLKGKGLLQEYNHFDYWFQEPALCF